MAQLKIRLEWCSPWPTMAPFATDLIVEFLVHCGSKALLPRPVCLRPSPGIYHKFTAFKTCFIIGGAMAHWICWYYGILFVDLFTINTFQQSYLQLHADSIDAFLSVRFMPLSVVTSQEHEFETLLEPHPTNVCLLSHDSVMSRWDNYSQFHTHLCSRQSHLGLFKLSQETSAGGTIYAL
jgi:hypothetical protein